MGCCGAGVALFGGLDEFLLFAIGFPRADLVVEGVATRDGGGEMMTVVFIALGFPVRETCRKIGVRSRRHRCESCIEGRWKSSCKEGDCGDDAKGEEESEVEREDTRRHHVHRQHLLICYWCGQIRSIC